LLSKHAQVDPQAAYSAFTIKDYAPDGPISKEQCTPDLSELFEPLENAIRDQLILALIG